MPFMIELVDLAGSVYDDVPAHRLAYAVGEETSFPETHTARAHLSERADLRLYADLPGPARNIALVAIAVFDRGGEPHPEIARTLAVWALIHPEGRWQTRRDVPLELDDE